MINDTKKLDNMGIEVLDEVERENVIKISGFMSRKLVETFPKCNFSYTEIYKILVSTPMFYALFPKGLARVNYFYNNSTIYFLKDFDFNNIGRFAFHECIHRLQEKRTKHGKVIRFGLCEVNEFSTRGLALNEGAIQYIVGKAHDKEKKMLQSYNIIFEGNSKYYPLLSNIIKQLAFLIGEDILVDSTLRGNNEFEYAVIDNMGESTYRKIERNCNEILQLKNCIKVLQGDYEKNKELILMNSDSIQDIYFTVQDQIYTSYFNKKLKNTNTIDDLNSLEDQFYLYETLIGSNPSYTAFDNYKIDFIEKINKKKNLISTKRTCRCFRKFGC